jgi:hypothetical protein
MGKSEIGAGTVIVTGVAVTGILGAAYVGYKYFVEPGQVVLGEYRAILEDIYKETKQFANDNAKLNPPIAGLLPWQEALLEEKKKVLLIIEPQVIKVLDQRNLDVNKWMEQLFITIAIGVVATVVVGAIVALIKAWWAKPEAQNLNSAHGHGHLMFEICMREFAELGQLDIASGVQNSITSIYNTYTAADLSLAATNYTSMLSTLMPGTIDYAVYSALLNYVSMEMSATYGIMAQMPSFWIMP